MYPWSERSDDVETSSMRRFFTDNAVSFVDSKNNDERKRAAGVDHLVSENSSSALITRRKVAAFSLQSHIIAVRFKPSKGGHFITLFALLLNLWASVFFVCSATVQ